MASNLTSADCDNNDCELESDQNQNLFVYSVIYMFLATFGVLLNTVVLLRLLALWLKQADRFFDGCAMPLTLMTFSDLLLLISVIVLAHFTFTSSPEETTESNSFLTVKCKVTMFVLHANSGISRWCWLFASAIRYAAVYHPLWHRRQWRIGHRALPLIFIISLVVNAFLLFTVGSDFPHCTDTSLSLEHEINYCLHAIEMTWSYFLPVCMTTVLDFRVLFLKPPRLPQHPNNQIEQVDASATTASRRSEQSSRSINNSQNVNGVRFKLQMAVYQWLSITSIGLLLNVPDVILRIAVMLNLDESNFIFSLAFRFTARLLYFAQFCINACYLSLVVFRRNTKSHTGINGRKAKKLHASCALIASLNEEALESTTATAPLTANTASAPLRLLPDLETCCESE